eukprot:3711183-Prymnesium_polylepis.1
MGESEGEEEYIDLDLEKTLTWTGNAVIVQAGGEFRLPLIVPHPSVLAIQFEVDGGYDIEFSLLFKDDQENDYQVVRARRANACRRRTELAPARGLGSGRAREAGGARCDVRLICTLARCACRRAARAARARVGSGRAARH